MSAAIAPTRELPDWVTVALARDVVDGHRRLAHPWEIEWEGEPWTVATDGHLLIAIRGAFGMPRADNERTPLTEVPPEIVRCLRDQRSAERTRHELELNDFRRWLGFDSSAPACELCGGFAERACSACNGTGEVELPNGWTQECDCNGWEPCPACWPAGLPRTQLDQGWVYAQPFNRALLRRLTVRLPFATAGWYAPADVAKAAVLRGDNWFALIMGLRPDAARKDAPRWPDDAPEWEEAS